MSCRLHCLHRTTGYHYYIEYMDWGVALADAKRLAAAGFVGVDRVAAPAAREPGARQREAQLLSILDHVQAQAQLALERETRLLALLEQAQAQSQLALEREARLLALVEAQQQRLLEAPPPSLAPVAPRPGAIPARWHRILAYLDQQGPHRPSQVAQALELPTAPDLMRRMAQAGLLVKTATPGFYELAPGGSGARPSGRESRRA